MDLIAGEANYVAEVVRLSILGGSWDTIYIQF
jgi:hypothetical protein